MRLLLIEDDAMIGETVRDLLVAEGMEVDWRQDGEAAEEALTGPAFQMVLLDLTLPPQGRLAAAAGNARAWRPDTGDRHHRPRCVGASRRRP